MFKKVAIQIINDMESRNLETFRKRILPFLKKIRESKNLKFEENMFGKHKFSKFLQQNPDIKALWENLPRLKSNKKSNTTRNNSTTGLEEEIPDLVKFESFSSNLDWEENTNTNEIMSEKQEYEIKMEMELKEPFESFGNNFEENKTLDFSNLDFKSLNENCFALNNEISGVFNEEIKNDDIWSEWKERSSIFRRKPRFFP